MVRLMKRFSGGNDRGVSSRAEMSFWHAFSVPSNVRLFENPRQISNGSFRNDVRDFFRGVPDAVRRVADRLVGSPEIYAHKQREPEQSVNFVTCHDGFTLNDLVSYNDKHNEANGEENRDGANDNRSWNCGIEGPTDDPAIEKLRNRQIKNFLAATMTSLGIPMILMGDEVRRTQRGNNNAYCHDNQLSWFDWSLPEKHAEIHRFASLLCGTPWAAQRET